jgi:hypothetical protein
MAGRKAPAGPDSHALQLEPPIASGSGALPVEALIPKLALKIAGGNFRAFSQGRPTKVIIFQEIGRLMFMPGPGQVVSGRGIGVFPIQPHHDAGWRGKRGDDDKIPV